MSQRPDLIVRNRRRRIRAAGALIVASLIGASAASAQSLTWDSGGLTPTNPTDGSGNWTPSTFAYWSNGATDSLWPNTGTAAFGHAHGAAGTVTVTSPVSAAGLTFNPAGSGNYLLNGASTISLFGLTPSLSANGAQPTIAAPITGTSGITIAGSVGGTITLSGSNSYSGATNVSSGTLILASANAFSGNSLGVTSGAEVDLNSTVTFAATTVNNNGSFKIALGNNISFTGNPLFNQSGGTLAINGGLSLSGGTFNYAGGSITGNPVVLAGSSGLSLGTSVSTGTFDFTAGGFQTLNLASPAFAVPAGVTLNAQPASGTGTVATFNTLTNNGTIALTAPAGGSVRFNVSSGFINNAAFAVSAAGVPSAAPVLNASSVANAAGATFDINTDFVFGTSGVTNNGSMTVAVGKAVSFTSSSPLFNQSGGTLAINGGLSLSGGTFNYAGGSITGNPVVLAGSSGLSLGTSVSTGTFDFTAGGFQTLNLASPAFAVPAGVTLNAQPASGTGTVATFNTLTNNGTIALTAPAGGSVRFNVSSGFINNAAFAVSAAGVPSAAPVLNASSVANAAGATFDINTDFVFGTSGVTNNGSMTVAVGKAVSFTSSSPLFNQSGGTLAINGGLSLSGGTFNYAGGSITGNPVVLAGSSGLSLGTSVSTGTFDFTAGGFQTLNLASPAFAVPAGVTLNAQPASGTGTVATFNTLTNNGTIALTAPAGGSVRFNVSSGFINNAAFAVSAAGVPSAAPVLNASSVANAAGATFDINTDFVFGTSGVTNNGSMTVAVGKAVSFTSSSPLFNQSGGTLAINGGLSLSGGTFNYAGGSITGNPVVLAGSSGLSLGTSVSTGTFDFTAGGFQTLNLASPAFAVPAGVTLNAQPASGTGTVATFNTLTNNGTIALTAPAGGSVRFNVSSGFINNAAFAVSAAGVPSAAPVLNASSVANAAGATFNVNTSLNLSTGITNSGNLNVAAGQTLTLGGTTPLFNQLGGTVSVGEGGSIPLSATGQLLISGGTLSLAAGTTPATLGDRTVIWPFPGVPQNPATDLASISTTAVGAGQLPGRIDLLSQLGNFNILDPNATLTISANITNGTLKKAGPGTLILNGSQGITGNLQVLAGSLTVGSTASLPGLSGITVSTGATLNVIGTLNGIPVTNNGTVNFPPAPAGSGFHVIAFPTVTLGAGKTTTIAPADSPTDVTVLVLNTLVFGGTPVAPQGQLDVTSNDLVIKNGSLSDVTNEVKAGFANGAENGQGVVSSAAQQNTSHLTAIGVIMNDDGSGHAIYGAGTTSGLFDGANPGTADVLAKYTYFGDANLDGAVDGSDYTKIDAAFGSQSTATPMTGWINGDYNYDGHVDGSDYTLIDNAFNTQGSSLGSNPLTLIAGSTAQVAGTSAVPEPASVCLLGVCSLALRRRRVAKAELQNSNT